MTSLDLRNFSLRGRDAEVESLRRAAEEARGGNGSLVLIEGDAGSGKTSLLSQLVHTRGSSFSTFIGEAEELGTHRILGPLLDALGCHVGAEDPSRRRIAHMVLATDPADAILTSELRLLDAIIGLTDELIALGAVLLVLEDLHWADKSTVRALRSLQRTFAHQPLLMAASLRPQPRSPELEALTRSADVYLLLQPLQAEAAEAIFEDLTGSLPGPNVKLKLAAADGNPLYINELVAGLVRDGALNESQEGLDSKEAQLPPSLRLTLIRRIGFLSDQAAQVLKSASILGSHFSVRDLCVITQRRATELLPLLEEAIAAGLLENQERRVRFRHALIREAIYSEIPSSARAMLHLETARALAADGAQPETVADHFVLGAEPGDNDAIEWLVAAGARAESCAPGVSVELYEKALALMDPYDPRRQEVQAAMIRPMVWVGRVDEAEAFTVEALQHPRSPDLEGLLRAGLADIYESQGRAMKSIEQHELKAEIPGLSEQLRFRFAAEKLRSPRHRGDFERIRQEAHERADTHALIESLRAEFRNAAARQPLPAPPEQLAPLVDLGTSYLQVALGALEEPSPTAVSDAGYAYFDMVDLHSRAWNTSEMRRAARGGLALASDRGAVNFLSLFQGAVAESLLLEGNLDDALVEVETAMQQAEEHTGRTQLEFPAGVATFIHVCRNDVRKARELVALDLPSGLINPAWGRMAQALLSELDGHLETAVTHLMPPGERWSIFSPLGTPDMMRLLLALGDESGARRWAEMAVGRPVLGEYCSALVAGDPERLEVLVPQWLELMPPLLSPAIHETLGDLKAAAGDREGAIRSLGQAEASALKMRVDLQVRRIHSKQRALGVTKGARGDRGRPKAGWESLTPTELEVVRLVAEGLSNPAVAERLFVTRRTVTTHLTHVFAKLGLSSRTELAVEASKRLS